MYMAHWHMLTKFTYTVQVNFWMVKKLMFQYKSAAITTIAIPSIRLRRDNLAGE